MAEALTTYGAQLIEIRRLQGRLHELAAYCDAMAAAVEENPGLPVLRVVLARMYVDLGRLDDARATGVEAIALGDSPLPDDYTWLPGHCVLAWVLAGLQLRDAAAAVYERLLPWQDQVASVGVTSEGPVALHLGLLAATAGDLDAAEAQYRRALAVADRLAAPAWRLRSQLGLAEVLARRGGPGDAEARAALWRELADAARQAGLTHLLAQPG